MKEIIELKLKKAKQILDQIGFKYAIIDSDNVKHGELELPKEPKPKRETAYPLGELNNYVKQYLKNIKKGDFVDIPYDKYEKKIIQRSACGFANKNWGGNTYTTHMRDEHLEVYRYIKEVKIEKQQVTL
jgi:hypothetical protein